jgi:hypothetical protein
MERWRNCDDFSATATTPLRLVWVLFRGLIGLRVVSIISLTLPSVDPIGQGTILL